MSSDATDGDVPVPVGVDPTRASVARVYDFLLGGKDNYKIDRQAAAELAAAMPDVVDIAKDNRAFLNRTARFVARQTGVYQYLDLGSGLPTAENVHQIVQRINPESKIVYVDHDPVVLAHGRASLEENEQTRLIGADITDPSSVLDNEVVREHLDFEQPIALFCLATLHNLECELHEATQAMRTYIDALPSGSFVAISHLYDPGEEDGAAMQHLVSAARKGALGTATARTKSQMLELFEGLELIQPNAFSAPDIVELARWWPDGPQGEPIGLAHRLIAGGVARKP
jgi:SAM-dependent methyltransferase